MVVKDLCLEQEAGDVEESALLQDPYEAEDALSLSDLPIYSGSGRWNDELSKEDGQSSSQSNNNDDDEFFEFFSEDFTASTRANVEKNIIFCGKIIPSKESSPVPQKGRNYESNINNSKQSNAQKGVLLPWMPNSFDKAKPISKSVKSFDGGFKKGQEIKRSKDLMRDYSIKKVSLLRSATKSRWYLLTFGMPRLPTEMELGDIRSRQSRRSPATMFPAPEQGGLAKSKGGRNVKGVWRMIRSLGLGCRSRAQANDVVKASFRSSRHGSRKARAGTYLGGSQI